MIIIMLTTTTIMIINNYKANDEVKQPGVEPDKNPIQSASFRPLTSNFQLAQIMLPNPHAPEPWQFHNPKN